MGRFFRLLTGFLGLFTGLFKRKPKSVEQTENGSSRQGYYLKPDDAKTYGNIEYMKKSITIKRTYAKTLSGGDIPESIRSISSMETKRLEGKEMSKTEQKADTPQVNNNDKKRGSHSNMDMFIKMAKDIKK